MRNISQQMLNSTFAGTGATSIHHRREAKTAWHHQARQSVRSAATHSWRPSGRATYAPRPAPARCLGRCLRVARPPKCRRSCPGQQTRPDQLGCAHPRNHLSAPRRLGTRYQSIPKSSATALRVHGNRAIPSVRSLIQKNDSRNRTIVEDDTGAEFHQSQDHT